MEASNITMFKDLDVSNNDCVLKVRILRLWRLKDNNKTGEDWSIEMILQDEMGDKMQAYVRKACIPKHDVWLGENQSLIVRKPSLGANLSIYRYVDSPHKLCFTSATRLCITDEFKGHLYGLSFATFDDIKAKNIPQNGTIGLLLSEAQLKNLALFEIQNFLLRNNCSLRCFPTMPFPDDDSITASTNRFMNEELSYDTQVMTERPILAPLNEVVEDINDRFLTLFLGEEVEYLSSDSIDNSKSVGPGFDPALHSPDFLNGLKMSGMPNHKLILKVGIPIMLIRNIDKKNGLCNGTRLQVIQLGRRFIEIKVISGTNIGHRTYITRSTLTPTDKKLTIKLKRRQFPVSPVLVLKSVKCTKATGSKTKAQSVKRKSGELFVREAQTAHAQKPGVQRPDAQNVVVYMKRALFALFCALFGALFAPLLRFLYRVRLMYTKAMEPAP
ncbi:uncharacterized protein LOC143615209 [Bidens hawaiensis]|uniref:uncharacterized protein LOC143615209 n=1 Tax=Bidens hawaiensis TaxID=980011 RepID=UPI00404A4C7B